MPRVSIIILANNPISGAAKVSVPKYFIGITFWISGEPGRAVIVKVNAPRAIVPGISLLGISASLNNVEAIG